MAQEDNLSLKLLHQILAKVVCVVEHHLKPAISGRLKPEELRMDAVLT